MHVLLSILFFRQITWYKSSEQQANVYEELLWKQNVEKQEKRSANHNDEDDPDNNDDFVDKERTSTVVPSYSTSALIEGLEGQSVYLTEVGFATTLSLLYNI